MIDPGYPGACPVIEQGYDGDCKLTAEDLRHWRRNDFQTTTHGDTGTVVIDGLQSIFGFGCARFRICSVYPGGISLGARECRYRPCG